MEFQAAIGSGFTLPFGDGGTFGIAGFGTFVKIPGDVNPGDVKFAINQ
jgi:hypothetical protein